MRLIKRLGVVAAFAVVSAAALFGVGATPALATPNFCTGDLCMNVAGQSLSTLYIHMWAFNAKFYGHFQLQTPEHTSLNSTPNKWYYAGGSGPTFAVPIVYGWYCGTAWRYNGGGSYTKLGYGCFIAGA
jgi:hypothetical protein